MDERFGLTAQLRRAAVSIPSNIAEGSRRRRRSFRHFLRVALGSQAEIDVQLELAVRLTFCSRRDYGRLQTRVAEIGRMLNGLIASIPCDTNDQRDG